jgi:hypothetical protein
MGCPRRYGAALSGLQGETRIAMAKSRRWMRHCPASTSLSRRLRATRVSSSWCQWFIRATRTERLAGRSLSFEERGHGAPEATGRHELSTPSACLGPRKSPPAPQSFAAILSVALSFRPPNAPDAPNVPGLSVRALPFLPPAPPRPSRPFHRMDTG